MESQKARAAKRPNIQAPEETCVVKATSTSVETTRAPAKKPVARPQEPVDSGAAGAVKKVRVQPGGSKVAARPKRAGSSEGTTTRLQSQLDSLASRMCQLEEEKMQQEGVASTRIKALEEELSSAMRKLTDTEHRLEAAEHSRAAVQRARDAVEAELCSARQESASLRATVSQMAADTSAVHFQLGAVKATRDQALAESRHKSETIARLEREREALLQTIEKCQQRMREDESQRCRLHNTIQELKGELVAVHVLEAAEHSRAAVQRARDHDAVEAELSSARQESASLRATVSQMAADASAVHCQLEAVKATRDQALAESHHKSEAIARLERERETLLQTIEECQQRMREDESQRRRLHNTIQELKGNIRVFCRVRPVLSSEGGSVWDDSTSSSDSSSSACSTSSLSSVKKDKGSLCIDYPDKGRDSQKVVLQYTPHEGDKSSRGHQYEFDFDHVFGPDCTQETVFGEISQLVQSALDGYNVCIFAYGQTGSGKTYTMEGPIGSDSEARGVIPRALEQVFSSVESLHEKGWSYRMEASFLEIYNETLRDLLSSSSKEEKHDIRMDSKNQGEVYVTNLTPVTITSQSQISQLLEVAAKNRSVAATLCNDRSSRSHCVFRLTLCGNNCKTKETCRGSLNLVDLAGSDRLSQSGSVGDRLKETKSINKSLSNLGNVIMALTNKEQHIPYRNSKLTYLLQNSLGGNSKTLMFVNMSPLPGALQETLCSLQFATKVNQCNIGTARKLAK